MATRNTVLSQTERAFLREALLTTNAAITLRSRGSSRSPVNTVRVSEVQAQELLNAYHRLIRRNSP